MRAVTTTLAVLLVAGAASQSLAQQGVRAKSPRRDAGQNALRMIAESQANRNVRQDTPDFAGPSNIAPRGFHRSHGRIFHHGGGISIGGSVGDVYGRLHLGGVFHDDHHFGRRNIVFVNRSPYFIHNGSYYRYRGYDPYDAPTRRQVVQSPTVIVIDRTGVSTNEVDPQEPVELNEADRVSARELGARALSAGNADQAIEFLTEHVLVNEGDRQAERLLGVAMLLDGRTELGIALISRAYTGDPEMAFEPIGRDTIDSLASWRKVQREVQRYAGIQRTASSWLAAIVLTQEELPNRTHEQRLEEARRAGLDVDIADAFQRYLEGGEPIESPEPEPGADEQEPGTEPNTEPASDPQ
ncbi:MAG: hypothetical protein NCW75_11295 [Phycisphaera sp.]|nr:MAG: hypothetical protein NCW75_11295 [Phycisphaera sp.]